MGYKARHTRAPAAPTDTAEELAVLRARVAAQDARFEAIVERGSDGVLVFDASGVLVFANAAAEAMMGRPRDELIGSVVGFPVLLGEASEIELVGPTHKLLYAEMRVVATEWEGRPCLLALLRDVTERHRVEVELAERSTHDHLTGLPNRFLLEDRLARALARLGRRVGRSGALAVFVVDVDDFKAVNDRLGHLAGDDLLVEVAARLMLALRTSDTAARFGGDEFVLVCESMDDDRCRVLTSRIKRICAKPIRLTDRDFEITVSVGYALTEDPACSAASIIGAADQAMYDVKGRERVGRSKDWRS